MTDMVDRKQTTRMAKIYYTEKERLLFGEQMANALRNLKQAGDELDSVKKQYGGKMKGFETEIGIASEKLNTGWEMKAVDCEEIRDFQTGTYLVKRSDTGEILEERALTYDERQMGLFDQKKEEGAEAPAGGGSGEDSAGEIKGQPEAEPGVEGAGATPEPSPSNESASLFEEEEKEEEDAD